VRLQTPAESGRPRHPSLGQLLASSPEDWLTEWPVSRSLEAQGTRATDFEQAGLGAKAPAMAELPEDGDQSWRGDTGPC